MPDDEQDQNEELEPEAEPAEEPEATPDEDPELEPEEDLEPEAEPEKESELSDDEPDERAPVPVPRFVAYKKKQQALHAASQAQITQMKADMAKAASRGDIDPQEYRRQKNALDKIKSGLEKYPEFDAVLAAFEQGIDPDLRVLAQALDPRVKALTTQDPATQRMLHEQAGQLREIQAQQFESRLERQMATETTQIRELYKGDTAGQDKILKAVNDFTRSAVEGMTEQQFRQFPISRLAIAKAFKGWSKTDRNAILQSQRDLQPVKKGAALPIPKKGAKPAADDAMPNPFTEPDAYNAWMTKEQKRQKGRT